MKPIKFLISATACLTFALPAAAIPEARTLDKMEQELREEGEHVETRVRHLREAAEHLQEAGLKDEANALREESERMVKTIEIKIAKLQHAKEEHAKQAATEVRRREEAARRSQAEAENVREEAVRRSRENAREAQLAERHQDQVAENWERIKDAGNGRRPTPDSARRAGDRPGARPVPGTGASGPPPTRVAPKPAGQPAYDRQSRILYEILRTLQDINSKLDAREEHSEEHHGHENHDAAEEHHDDHEDDDHDDDHDHDHGDDDREERGNPRDRARGQRRD